MKDIKCIICNGPNKRENWDKNYRCENCYIIFLKGLLDDALSKKEYFDKLYNNYLTVGKETELNIEECIKQIKYENKALSDIVGVIEKRENKNIENEK